MVAVATGNEVAGEGFGSPCPLVDDLRRVTRNIERANVLRLVDNPAAVALTHPIQLLGDCRLAERPHRLAAMLDGIDQKRLAVLPCDPTPVVRVAFALHPLAQARLPQKLDRSPFEHAGADPLQHMRLRLPFEHDAVDPAEVKQMRQEHARRTAADDRDLGALHDIPPRSARPLCTVTPARPRGSNQGAWRHWRERFRTLCRCLRPLGFGGRPWFRPFFDNLRS